MNIRQFGVILALLGCAGPASGQSGERARPLPSGFGSLSQNELALRVGNDEIEIFVRRAGETLVPALSKMPGFNGYYLVSRGDRTPWRMKLRTASFGDS